METNKKKRDSQLEKEQPGDMASFNNRDKERSVETEGAGSNAETENSTDGKGHPEQLSPGKNNSGN